MSLRGRQSRGTRDRNEILWAPVTEGNSRRVLLAPDWVLSAISLVLTVRFRMTPVRLFVLQRGFLADYYSGSLVSFRGRERSSSIKDRSTAASLSEISIISKPAAMYFRECPLVSAHRHFATTRRGSAWMNGCKSINKLLDSPTLQLMPAARNPFSEMSRNVPEHDLSTSYI